MNAQEKKDAVISVELIGTNKRTSNSYGRNLQYRSYRVFIVRKDESGELYRRELSDVFTKEELKDLCYWSNRSYSMAMTCWGTSQQFEAQLALGRFLFPKQKKGEEWGDYCRRITAKIKEL